MGLLIFILAQASVLYMFYFLVIRKLPDLVNELILERHLANDFTEIPKDIALEVRQRLIELERERLDAVVAYAALKGRRNLSVTDREEREKQKRIMSKLDRQIRGVRGELTSLYGSDVVRILRRFEETRFATALNSVLDRGISRGRAALTSRRHSRRGRS